MMPMSEEVSTGRGRTMVIAAWVVVPVLLLAALLAMTLRNRGTSNGTTKNGTTRTTTTQEIPLATVRHPGPPHRPRHLPHRRVFAQHSPPARRQGRRGPSPVA